MGASKIHNINKQDNIYPLIYVVYRKLLPEISAFLNIWESAFQVIKLGILIRILLVILTSVHTLEGRRTCPSFHSVKARPTSHLERP